MIPDLINIEVPLQERYDQFLKWVSEQGNSNPEYLAPKLKVHPSIVDLFYELGALDAEEFSIIDEHKIDVGILYLIVHFNKTIRRKIYPRIDEFKLMAQPLSAIRDFVDDEIVSVYSGLLKQISGGYWKSIAAYLKAKDVDIGLLKKGVRGFFYSIGKHVDNGNELTINQLEYAAQIIVYDDEYKHGVFLNDQVQKDFSEDYELMVEAIELIKGLVEANR
jgi:hypothetical protein